MKDIDDIFFNEQWDKVLDEVTNNKNLISAIDPSELAWKRFQYQLAQNGKEELVFPFGNISDLLKLTEFCKNHGLLGLTIPQATAFQQTDQIKKLLDAGHNIDEEDFGERTGLLVASALNDFELVKFFITNGAFVSFYDQDNYEAIDLTTSHEIIELLQKHNGRTKEQRQQEYDEYCDAQEYWNVMREINISFMNAAQTGNLKQMTDALQKSSMDFFTLNFAFPINGKTALHLAVENNKIETVEFLLTKGVDKTKKDNDGLTAFEKAKKMNLSDIIKIFENNEKKYCRE